MNATGESTLSVSIVNLTLTTYATGLAVVSGNATGGAGPKTAAVVKIKDYCSLAKKD